MIKLLPTGIYLQMLLFFYLTRTVQSELKIVRNETKGSDMIQPNYCKTGCQIDLVKFTLMEGIDRQTEGG